MNCPNCQTPNRVGANFCKHCGSLLVQACPRCSSALPEAAHFCDNCGLRLVDSEGFMWRPSAQGAAVQTPAVQTPMVQTTVPQTTGEKPAIAARPASPPPASAVPSPASEARASQPLVPLSAPLQPASPPASPSSPAGESQLQQYIPKELMAKLESARLHGEMVGERRVVTMLFCDVKGSTAATDRMDPEEWSEIINGAFEQMIRPVYKYEGTVARLMGDGLLAFFGAPIAHEDDPQRAVLAGLDIVAGIKPYREQIKQAHDIDFDVRVGINTGLVVVGAVGSDLRMEYTALGDAINLAARMEQTAKPGTVQVAHNTYKLVKPLFDFEELGGIEVKGKREPVPAYRVLGRQAMVGRARGIEGLYAEMVGRESELLSLRGVIADLKQGVGRIVCVLGEAGLGKTRLVTETTQVFKELIGPDGDWYETISLSYETNQAYGLFQRLMRRVKGIAYNDPPPVIRERLTALVDSLPEERRPGATQVFEALFGLESENRVPPLEGETFKQEMFEAMHAWWRAQFSSRPTVLVFDDMHWSDATSIELLRRLLPLTEDLPLVLICALRTERQAPAWQIKTTADEEFRHRYTEISLRPLSEAESNELLNRLLAIPELPDRLRASILEKSGGNPFFIEEVVRSLIESGAVVSEERTVDGVARRYWRATVREADFEIPDNLQSLLAARIDRLEEATRATLQMASVIGRSFFHRVLLAVDEASQELDKHLGTLIRLDMIREAARVPEVEYTFLNPLTQEAVYNTILLKRRRDFHRRVGEAIEALYPDRLEGFYGLLAHHFALGGQPGKAIEYHRQASRQAVAVYAYDEAAQNLRAALELIDPGGRSAVHIILLEELADVYHLVRDFTQAISLYRQALDPQRNLADGQEIVAVRLHRKIVQMATQAKWNMDLDHYRQASQIALESRTSLEHSLEALQDEPAQPEIVLALATLSFEAWRNQIPPDWERAQRFAQQAVDMAERLDDPVVLSQALGALANILDGRSLLREHLQVAHRRLEISQQARLDNPSERIDALSGAGMALMYVGEYAQAMQHLREAETLAASVQAIGQQTVALGLQGQCWFRLDRWDEVFATEERWRDLERRYPRQRVGGT